MPARWLTTRERTLTRQSECLARSAMRTTSSIVRTLCGHFTSQFGSRKIEVDHHSAPAIRPVTTLLRHLADSKPCPRLERTWCATVLTPFFIDPQEFPSCKKQAYQTRRTRILSAVRATVGALEKDTKESMVRRLESSFPNQAICESSAHWLPWTEQPQQPELSPQETPKTAAKISFLRPVTPRTSIHPDRLLLSRKCYESCPREQRSLERAATFMGSCCFEVPVDFVRPAFSKAQRTPRLTARSSELKSSRIFAGQRYSASFNHCCGFDLS